jgi:hypothetical protein
MTYEMTEATTDLTGTTDQHNLPARDEPRATVDAAAGWSRISAHHIAERMGERSVDGGLPTGAP